MKYFQYTTEYYNDAIKNTNGIIHEILCFNLRLNNGIQIRKSLWYTINKKLFKILYENMSRKLSSKIVRSK